ncbi:MAG: HIT domain-containing protein [Parcubacteria group bacterium]|jgi:histidine triad (HIT) family protein
MGCPFCDVVNISKIVLFQTDFAIAIMNLYPVTRGHLLVVPKLHVSSLSELGYSSCCDLITSIQKVTNIVKMHLKPEGVNVFLNEGKIAGQTLEHLHVHVVPRYIDDNLRNFERMNSERILLSENDSARLREIFGQ